MSFPVPGALASISSSVWAASAVACSKGNRSSQSSRTALTASSLSACTTRGSTRKSSASQLICPAMTAGWRYFTYPHTLASLYRESFWKSVASSSTKPDPCSNSRSRSRGSIPALGSPPFTASTPMQTASSTPHRISQRYLRMVFFMVGPSLAGNGIRRSACSGFPFPEFSRNFSVFSFPGTGNGQSA